MGIKGILANTVLWIAFFTILAMLYNLFTSDFIAPVGGNVFLISLIAVAIAYVVTFGAAIHYGQPRRSRFFGFLLFF